MYKKYLKVYAVLFIINLISSPVFADKSSVTIDAPDKAKKGEVITIKVKVTHNSNNFMHYTNWVYIKINDKEISRWDFTGSNLPEAEVFTREVKYKVVGSFTIEAQANCNLHGSKGKIIKKVEVQ